jgi:hypothetical protein
VETLVHHHEIARTLGEPLVTQAEPAADVYEAVFLARHGGAVGELADLAEDVGDELPALTGLALLDEPRVLDRARRVEDDLYAVPPRVLTDLAQVGEAHRLAARHVHRRRDRDVRHARRAMALHDGVELREIHVPFERVLRRGIVRLVDDHVVEGATRELLMRPRGSEVHVAGDVIARRNEDVRQNVLGTTSLVGRNEVRVAVVLANGALERVEVSRARVRFVTQHHAGPLPVGHRARPGVGEQVDVHVVGPEQERVVPRVPDGALALRARGETQRLDDFHSPGLGPALVAHASSPPALADALCISRTLSARSGSRSQGPADMASGKLRGPGQ